MQFFFFLVTILATVQPVIVKHVNNVEAFNCDQKLWQSSRCEMYFWFQFLRSNGNFSYVKINKLVHHQSVFSHIIFNRHLNG